MCRKNSKGLCARQVLRIPDPEQSKLAVFDTLPARTSREACAHAIDELIPWYRLEPRLAFSRTVVLTYIRGGVLMVRVRNRVIRWKVM